jgi:hypothetical protein
MDTSSKIKNLHLFTILSWLNNPWKISKRPFWPITNLSTEVAYGILLIVKDNIAKMLQPILMTTFSSSLFVGQGGRAKEYKESL